MWEEVEARLKEINVEDLGYDHPLCSGILDDGSVPIINISDRSREIFNASSNRILIPTSEMIMNSCEQFIQKEKEKGHVKKINNFGDVQFGEFLDHF